MDLKLGFKQRAMRGTWKCCHHSSLHFATVRIWVASFMVPYLGKKELGHTLIKPRNLDSTIVLTIEGISITQDYRLVWGSMHCMKPISLS